jgi:cyanate permease
MSFLFFGLACGGQALIFWIPQIIRGLGVKSIANVGFLAAIPFATAIVILIVVSWTSDLCRERRWHYAVLALIQAAGCAILPSLSHSLGWSMVVLALSLGASASAIPFVFFIAPTYLRRQVVAIGVAIVNSLGLTAGFVGSSVLGVIKNHTGSFAVAFYIFSFLAVLAALTMLTLVSPKAVRVGISASK